MWFYAYLFTVDYFVSFSILNNTIGFINLLVKIVLETTLLNALMFFKNKSKVMVPVRKFSSFTNKHLKEMERGSGIIPAATDFRMELSTVVYRAIKPSSFFAKVA